MSHCLPVTNPLYLPPVLPKQNHCFQEPQKRGALARQYMTYIITTVIRVCNLRNYKYNFIFPCFLKNGSFNYCSMKGSLGESSSHTAYFFTICCYHGGKYQDTPTPLKDERSVVWMTSSKPFSFPLSLIFRLAAKLWLSFSSIALWQASSGS